MKVLNRLNEELASVYRAAARRIETRKNWCCCPAIDRARDDVDADNFLFSMAQARFREYFRPVGGWASYWWGDDTPAARNARVMALLLMAEMADRGEL